MSKTKEATAGSPYLDARREWNERYGDHIKAATTARALAFGSCAVALLAVAGLAYSASQNHIVPYVIEVDKLHAVLPIGPADQAARTDPAVVRAVLMSWIERVRLVSTDAAAQRKAALDSYAYVQPQSSASGMLNEYFTANDPFKRAATGTVSIEVESVLPVAGDTWRVEWREISRTREGQTIATDNWQANITTSLNPPKKDDAAAAANPFGVYVTAVNWSKRL